MVANVEWLISQDLVPYPDAVTAMEDRVQAIISGEKPELIWLLEHPPLYTAGTSAKPEDLLDPNRFPVFQTGRGGQLTYHGPGQRVGYLMLDLKKRGRDIRAFIHTIEEWLIQTLAEFGVNGERRQDRIGIWVVHNNQEKKIAAIGVRVRQWVTYHGFALNVHPDLSHFSGINPCGISLSHNYSVTSLAELGLDISLEAIDQVLKQKFL